MSIAENSFASVHACLKVGMMALAFATIGVTAKSQDLYVSDSGSGSVYRLKTDGTKTLFASGLLGPHGIAFDSAGNAYVAQFSGDSIMKIGQDGVQSTFFTTGLHGPEDLAMDKNDNLYVSNFLDGAILKIAPNAASTVFATGVFLPKGLAIAPTGDLLVAETGKNQLDLFTPTGSETVLISGIHVTDLAFDSHNNLFATDATDNSMLKIATDGTVSTYASGLNFPWGVAVDGNDDIFASEINNNRIDYGFNGSGYSTFATWLHSPTYLAFGPADAPINGTPEPGTWALLGGLSITAAAASRRRNAIKRSN